VGSKSRRRGRGGALGYLDSEGEQAWGEDGGSRSFCHHDHDAVLDVYDEVQVDEPDGGRNQIIYLDREAMEGHTSHIGRASVCIAHRATGPPVNF
jgi:hypothetical protein